MLLAYQIVFLKNSFGYLFIVNDVLLEVNFILLGNIAGEQREQELVLALPNHLLLFVDLIQKFALVFLVKLENQCGVVQVQLQSQIIQKGKVVDLLHLALEQE